MKVTASSPVVTAGSSGSAVRELQQLLKARGFNPGPVDGMYGPKTRAAVIAFQKSRHLAADGIAGPQTWAALRAQPASTGGALPTLQLGAKGSQVVGLQQVLRARGFNPGPIDGVFGNGTRAAVIAFQKSRGLVADGIVGPKTWAALKSAGGSTSTGGVGKSSGAHPTLQVGARGAAVSALQQQLKSKGFNPGPIDGVFGNGTRAAVIAFQAANGLSVDGVVGPQTWAALASSKSHGPGPVTGASGSVRQKILDTARSQLGTLETGNNGGPCLKYQNYFGRGYEPWCADFVSWVLTHSGVPFNDPYCPSIENKLKAAGKWKGKHNPQPGDLVLFNWDGGVADHIGIVEKVNPDGSFVTIEGNTGNPSTGQQGVWRRTRYLSQVDGFGSP